MLCLDNVYICGMKILIAFFTLLFILSGCENENENEIIGTWKAQMSYDVLTGSFYVTETYTSDYTYELCTHKTNGDLTGCDKKLTYQIDKEKIVKSDGTSFYFCIVKKDHKKYLRRYLDDEKKEFSELEKID